MKRTLVLLASGALLALPLCAQTDTNAPPSGPPPEGHHHHGPDMDFLTADEKAELKKDHDAALAADPSLAAEEKKLHADMEAAHEAGGPPSADVMDEAKDFHDKLDAAMLKIDPGVQPILDKLKAHRPHGGMGGPPPPPPSGT
jgi:hypothetical protein